MEMMTFECQDEYDRFLNDIAANFSSYSFLSVASSFIGIFVGTYRNYDATNSPNSFINYESGASVYPKISYRWLPGNPDAWNNIEWCIAIESFYRGSVGMNDYTCNDLDLRFFPACQKVTIATKAKGMIPNKY